MTLSTTEPPLWELILVPNIINVLIILSLYGTMLFYYSRRDFFPIKGRGNRAILTCGFLYSFVLLSCSARGPGYPCWVDQLIYCIVSHCASAVYVNRMAVLLIKQEIANELQFGYAKRLSSSPIAYARRSCLHNPRFYKFLKFRKWIFVLLAYGLLVAGVALGAILALGDNFECNNPVNVYSNALLLVILVPLMGSMSWKLRKFPSDGRKISVEFRCMAFAIVAALITQTLILQLTHLQYTSIYLRDTVGVFLLATSLIYPIYLSYGLQMCRKKLTASPATTALLSLEDLLRTEDFRQAFLMHLKSEFNAESLIFWEAASEFKDNGVRESALMIRDIQELMNTYLAEGATYLLNTSLDSIEDARARFVSAQETGTGFLEVFDGLLNEVLHLMKSDPLPRFLRTSAGRVFLVTYDPSSRRANPYDPTSEDRSTHKSVALSAAAESPRRPSVSVEEL